MGRTGLLSAMDKFAYISIVLTFMAGVGLSSMYFSDLQPEVTINRTEADIHQTTNVEPPRYNYIQANNHELNYSWKGTGIQIKNIDLLVNVNGLSMRPTMFTGHTALARNFTGGELDEGTIVYTESGLVHRINADYTETDGYYLTRGDNNRGSERVKPEEIHMVVVGVLFTEERD
jgi:hypothetical protein